uniref:NSP2 n=1 Tax=Crocidura shantungensis seadorna-like virus 2 TaxID=3139546 RepID=A0AB38ZK67_9REOV
MLFTPISTRRLTQLGGVPLVEIRTRTRIPTCVRKLIVKWLLNMLNDEEIGKQVEDRMMNKMTDVFFSADKLSRICQRLEDEDDVIHDLNNSINAMLVACNAINSSISTEGKCDIVRATEDAIIAKFDMIPEHLIIGTARKTFYKAFPVDKNTPMMHGASAMLALSNRDFIMNHGHGHLRTIPYHEIESAIHSFMKKTKDEIYKIKNDIHTPMAGERFKIMLDMIDTGCDARAITMRIQQFFRKDKKEKKDNDQ